MRVQMLARGFECAITTDPPHSTERARWQGGFWADICTRHMEIYRKNCAALRSQQNPLWFLGKKETRKS